MKAQLSQGKGLSRSSILASGFSAIRTRSEEQLKTANGELARVILKLNAHLSTFLYPVLHKFGGELAEVHAHLVLFLRH